MTTKTKCCNAKIEDGVCIECGLPSKEQFLKAINQMGVSQ